MSDRAPRSSEVLLVCPECGRRQKVAREPTDYPDAVRVEVLCDGCDDGGGFPEVFQYDAAGNHITRDPNL